MTTKQTVKKVKSLFSPKIMVSVAGGMALFGATFYFLKRIPATRDLAVKAESIVR